MGFCIGGKWCSKDKCRGRCKSWFGAQPDIERACRGACSGDVSFTKEDFLCSGNYIDQSVVIGAYRYDPCPNSGPTVDGYLDPLNDRAREDNQQKSLTWIVVGGALLLGFALWTFIQFLKKREVAWKK